MNDIGTLCLAALLASPALLSAQHATVLLREGDALPGGLTVTKINSCDTNGVGGYVTLAVATDGSGEKVSLAWGSADGVAAPGILFREGTYQGLQQSSWNGAGEIDDAGRIIYRAQGVGPGGAFDAIWIDGATHAVEGQPSTLPGSPPWGTFGSWGLTEQGQPWFTVLATDVGGVFVGDAATPLYASQDVVPGFTGPLVGSGSIALSSDGVHHLASLLQSIAGVGTRPALALDGSGLTIGGALVEHMELIVPELGGNGEDFWASFNDLDANASGEWCFHGRYVRPSVPTILPRIIRNSAVAYDSGDVVDGAALPTNVQAVDLSDRGQMLHAWTGALAFVDDALLTSAGDAVDFDGDGDVDPAFTINQFGVTAHVHLSEDGWVYFRAEIHEAGVGPTTCLLRIPTAAPPSTYCTPKLSSSGCAAVMRTTAPLLAPLSGAGDESVLCTGVEGQRNGLLFWSADGPAAIPFLGGTLCVAPPLFRTAAQPSMGSPGACNGSFELLLNDGVSPWDAGPGGTTWWQAWYRDPLLGDGFDVALSNAIEITFR